MTLSFCKEERLYGKRLFDNLLRDNKNFVRYPIRVLYRIRENKSSFPARIAVSVGKRRFKHAVDRNIIRRKIKESYRLNKSEFFELIPDNMSIDILFIYLDYNILDYDTINKALKASLEKITRNFLTQGE